MWVNFAESLKNGKFEVKYYLIHVNTSVEECKRRAKERKLHPTLDIEKADGK